MEDLVGFTSDDTTKAVPVADSRLVAHMFGKEHKTVLRDIRELLETNKEALREQGFSKSKSGLAESNSKTSKLSTEEAESNRKTSKCKSAPAESRSKSKGKSKKGKDVILSTECDLPEPSVLNCLTAKDNKDKSKKDKNLGYSSVLDITEHTELDCRSSSKSTTGLAESKSKSKDKKDKNVKPTTRPEITKGLTPMKDLYRKSTYTVDLEGGGSRTSPCYLITEEGLTLLVMRFKGKTAFKVQRQFNHAFYVMREDLQQLKQVRAVGKVGRTHLEDSIDTNLTASSFIYTNYSDLINKKVLGMSSKQFKEAHELCKTASIRDYLNEEALKALSYVETKVGFLVEHYKEEGLTDKEVYALIKSMPVERLLPKVKPLKLDG